MSARNVPHNPPPPPLREASLVYPQYSGNDTQLQRISFAVVVWAFLVDNNHFMPERGRPWDVCFGDGRRWVQSPLINDSQLLNNNNNNNSPILILIERPGPTTARGSEIFYDLIIINFVCFFFCLSINFILLHLIKCIHIMYGVYARKERGQMCDTRGELFVQVHSSYFAMESGLKGLSFTLNFTLPSLARAFAGNCAIW